MNTDFTALRPIAARAPKAAVFLDIDGVLAAIQLRPEDSFVPERTKGLIADILGRYALVATVSGRSAADSRRLISLPGLVTVGNHGLEIEDSSGRGVHGSAEELAPVRAAVQVLLGDVALGSVGVRVEDKGGSVSLHTRGAADEQRAWEVAVAAAQAAATANDLALLPGRAVIDLRPPGVTKGFAVRALLEREGLAAAVYVGDDRTDLDAFRALAALRDDGLLAVNVAVVSPEVPEGLVEAADLAIEQEAVPDLLVTLRDQAAPAASGDAPKYSPNPPSEEDLP